MGRGQATNEPRQHGLDFADLDTGFFSEAALGATDKGRFVAIGEWAEITITVVLQAVGRRGHFGDLHATREPKERRR